MNNEFVPIIDKDWPKLKFKQKFDITATPIIDDTNIRTGWDKICLWISNTTPKSLSVIDTIMNIVSSSKDNMADFG